MDKDAEAGGLPPLPSVYESRASVARPEFANLSKLAGEGRERSRNRLDQMRQTRLRRQARAARSSVPCVRICANAWIYLCLQCLCTVFVVVFALYVASLMVAVVDITGITSLPPGIDVVSYQPADLRPALEYNTLLRAEEAIVTTAEQAAEAVGIDNGR